MRTRTKTKTTMIAVRLKAAGVGGLEGDGVTPETAQIGKPSGSGLRDKAGGR